MILHLFKFFSRIHKAFSCVALFCALLSAGFLSAKYELKIEHDPKAVMLSFAKDGHASKLLVMNIDPKTGTFANRDYMHELLDIEPVYGGKDIKLSYNNEKNDFSAMLGINGALQISTMTMHDDMIVKSDADIVLDGVLSVETLIIIGEHGAQIDNKKALFIRNLMVGCLLINHGTIYGPADARLTALELVNNGTITGALRTDKEEKLGNTFVIKADTITNKGLMIGGQNFELQATKDIANYGTWTTNKQFTVKTPQHMSNLKTINGPGSFTADVGMFDNPISAGGIGELSIGGAIDINAHNGFSSTGKWQIAGDQTLRMPDFNIAANQKFEISGNAAITCNNLGNQGLLAIGGNATLDCRNYYNHGATLAKGTLTFKVPGNFQNFQTGRIESLGFLTVDATNFLNQAGFIFGHNGGRINADTFKNEFIVKDLGSVRYNYFERPTYDRRGSDTGNVNSFPCQISLPDSPCDEIDIGYGRMYGSGAIRPGHCLPSAHTTDKWTEIHNYDGSNPPIIAISNGRFELNVHKSGSNDVGIIAAEKDILITAPAFNNNAFQRQTVQHGPGGKCDAPYGKPDYWYYDWNTRRPYINNVPFDYHRFPSTIISNGGSVKVKVGNAECNVKNPGEQCNLNGFTNTGYVGAKQNIEFTAAGLAKFYNGLSQGSNAIVIQENAQSFNIAILPLQDPRNLYVVVPTNDPKALYQFDSPLAMQQQVQIDPRQQVYLDDGQSWTDKPRNVLSPFLQADGIQQALAVLIGRNVLPAYENMFQQFIEMAKQGLRIGFVHGTLKAIGNEPLLGAPQQENHNTLDTVNQAQYATVIKELQGTITPQVLSQHVQKWSDGNHVPVLTQEQINSLPFPFLYYSRIPGTNLVIPNLHVPKELQQKLWSQPGTIEAGGTIQTIGFDYAENTGKMLGNKIIIKANTFTNRRRTTTHTEAREQSGGWFGSDKTIHYEIETPESFGGEMVATTNIDIEADNDITNQGGLIMSVDVHMKSKNGSVINTYNKKTHIKDWDTGFWGDAFGDDSSALVLDFQPGMIIAGGNLKMLSPKKNILNIASAILAKAGELNGYLGVLSETLVSVNTASTSRSHSWFAFEGSEHQEYRQGPAIMSFDTVKLVSEKGSSMQRGAQFTANEAEFDTQNNIFEPVTVLMTHKLTEGGVKNFAVFGSSSNIEQKIIIPSVVKINKATFKAQLDNSMEAVFMMGKDGGKAEFIHFIAGRDNIFKGAHQSTTVDTTNFSIGVSFFGSEAMSKLASGQVKGAFIALAEEDPLVRSFKKLKNAKDWQDRTGEGTHVGIEILRSVVDYINAAQQAGQSLKNNLGQRYGITDDKGMFKPTVRFRCELSRSTFTEDQTIPSLVYVKDIIVESKRNTELLDGSKIKADNASFDVGDKLIMTSGRTVRSMIQSIYGHTATFLGKNFAAAGNDYTHATADSVTHDNARVEVAKKLFVKVRDLIARGGLMLGNVVDMRTTNMCFESVQNMASENMIGGAFNVGFGYDRRINLQAGMTASTHDSAQTVERSGIFATHQLTVDNTGTITLTGANFEQIEPGSHGSYVKTSLLEAHDLTDYDTSDAQSFSIDTSAIGSGSSASTPFDVNIQSSNKVVKQHAHIGQNINLQAGTIAGDKLARNAAEQTEVIEDSKSHWRIVAPIINTKRVGNALEHVGDLFKNKASQHYS